MGGTPEQGEAAEGSLVACRRLGQWRLEVEEAGWREAAALGGRGSGHGSAGRQGKRGAAVLGDRGAGRDARRWHLARGRSGEGWGSGEVVDGEWVFLDRKSVV